MVALNVVIEFKIIWYINDFFCVCCNLREEKKKKKKKKIEIMA